MWRFADTDADTNRDANGNTDANSDTNAHANSDTAAGSTDEFDGNTGFGEPNQFGLDG